MAQTSSNSGAAGAHTPGPWKVKEWAAHDEDGALEACGLQVVAVDGLNEQGIFTITDESDEDPAVANLHLIAAAPQMLEALHHAETWISAAPHGDNCFVSAHYEGDPGDRCNCGKDAALKAVQDAIAATTAEA